MRQRRHALSAAVVAVLTSLPLPGTAALNPRDTSVQMFQWSWPDIARECTEWLGPQGYGAVQISPPHASKVADGWWGVYQPVNYLDLTSRMGTPAQLQQMIDTCHAAGVRVYADVVVNQMADGSGTATDGSTWDGGSLRYPAFSGFDFHPHCVIQPSDYEGPSGRQRVMDCRLGGLPDLATENGYVQGQIADYLRRLLDLGVDGFRIDAAKHMPVAPWQAILSAVRSTHPLTRQGEPMWVTQEIIPDGGVDRAEYFGLGTVNEFKFTYAMRQVFRGEDGLALADIPTLMGSWGQWGGSWGFMPPQYATVFVNNWDTERNGSSLTTANHSPGAVNDTAGTKRYDLANIYMLTQGYGEAQLHSGFRFTHHDADRPATSPFRDGQPQINVVWDFVHRWSDISNLVKFRSAMAGQPQQRWTVGDNRQQVAFSRGNAGFVAINNSGQAWQRQFATGLPAGTYCNVVQGTLTPDGNACTGGTVTVQADGGAALTIGPNDGGSVPAVVIYTGQKVAGPGGSGCSVRFTIAEAHTQWGQEVVVVGDTPALGQWDPARGVALRIQGSGADAPWSGTVALPARSRVQYKYLKWNGRQAVWESAHPTPSGNREFSSCGPGRSQRRDDGAFRH